MTETTQTTETKTTSAVELTVTDLANVRSILEAAVRRGAFSASELSAVGAAYDKLNNFLNSVQASQPAKDSDPAAE